MKEPQAEQGARTTVTGGVGQADAPTDQSTQTKTPGLRGVPEQPTASNDGDTDIAAQAPGGSAAKDAEAGSPASADSSYGVPVAGGAKGGGQGG